MNMTAKHMVVGFQRHAKNFSKLTVQAFIKPESTMKKIGEHPLYGLFGYVLLSGVLALILSYFGANLGFIENSDQIELAMAALVVLPLMMLIPAGFVHLNATVMNMGGSFWAFYSRIIWSIYLWFVATFLSGVIITATLSVLPIKVLGFFNFLPYFFVSVFLYLSLKVTNGLPHWKALAVWVISGTLFYLAVVLLK